MRGLDPGASPSPYEHFVSRMRCSASVAKTVRLAYVFGTMAE